MQVVSDSGEVNAVAILDQEEKHERDGGLVILMEGLASKISEEKIDKMVRKLKDKENFNERIEQAFSKCTLDIKNNLK
ncbi:Hypothetical predicted protein [Olea europaea subsp. europaea]|uniref:Uncharacterized protein n=1 Tax=Olea europaea subsp. europaea TaxID=158383 RepID=A0A8S0USH2_OLEEU|nr:Hypothetical predicted protein [Olea europaea subsp. europaea]